MKKGYSGHLGRSSSHSINAGGIPSEVCGGTIRPGSAHPIHQSRQRGSGINGGGKGPAVSQDKPKGTRRGGYTPRKIAVGEGRRNTVA